MQTIWNLARATTGFTTAVALTLLGPNVAMASDPLAPASFVNPVRSTSIATEPDLAGPRFSRAVTFKVKDATGAVVCWGRLEQTVIRSNSTHYFHFYYRIRTSGGTAWLDRFTTPDFGFLRLSVAYLRKHTRPFVSSEGPPQWIWGCAICVCRSTPFLRET